MSHTEARSNDTGAIARAGTIDMNFEVVVLPVTDVERAKEFYVGRLGWRVDADVAAAGGFRLVQLTPPAARSSSAPTSRPPRPVRPRAST